MITDSAAISEAVTNIVIAVASQEKFRNPKIAFQAGSSEGDGYVAVNVAVVISEGDRVLNLFIKTTPEDEKLRQMFANGISSYRNFYRKRTDRAVDIVPKFYAANDAAFQEVLVLQNLKSDGFTMYGAMTFLSQEHVQLVMREYGKFHGISFAMQEQEPKVFAEITKDLPDVMFATADSIHFLQTAETRYKILKKYWRSPSDTELVEKVNNIPSQLKASLSELDNYKRDHRVLTHGDCWSNNMLYRKQNDQLELRLIDFQAIKLTSFAADLCYFFYASAPSEENLPLLTSFLDIYYESLSSTIKELGSDPEKVCPRHVIEAHWKIFSLFGLLVGSAGLAFMAGYSMELTRAEESKETTAQLMAREMHYARLMKPFFQHFIDNGFI